MKRNIVEGNLKELKGRVREKWGWWSHQYSHVVSGKFDKLIGRLQVLFGKMKK